MISGFSILALVRAAMPFDLLTPLGPPPVVVGSVFRSSVFCRRIFGGGFR
jgi:hypothetical protein